MIRYSIPVLVSFVVIAMGCRPSSTPVSLPAATSLDRSAFFLTESPSDPQSVIAAKGSAQDGDEITLTGRIGGSTSPFVAGRAAFTVVDASLTPCNEREDDTCATPWDYCCDTDALPEATVVVKLVDDRGQTIGHDAKTDLGLKELQTIVVRGKAKRDEARNLTILAQKIYAN